MRQLAAFFLLTFLVSWTCFFGSAAVTPAVNGPVTTGNAQVGGSAAVAHNSLDAADPAGVTRNDLTDGVNSKRAKSRKRHRAED